jgi:NOL1/NOP2/fmu family ribosome biogenesis protein
MPVSSAFLPVFGFICIYLFSFFGALGFLKNRFEPSHALALALRPEEVTHTWNLDGNSQEALNYLKGGTFPAEGEKGWYLITVDGYSIGWGKLAGGIMKNHYPKGLRKN